MQTTRRELAPGVNLRCVHTNKFKSAYLSVTMMLPLEAERASLNALLPYVLRRGTRKHPDLEALSAALDELYGGAIEPMVRKRGETQCVGLVAGFLDDKYALDGRPILEPAAALVGEILLNPFTQDGVFCPEYTAGERANLIDRIHSQINDKRTYAVQRLTQEMCRYENFGVDRLGDETSAAAITPESLWARYQELLAQAEFEVYYCGCAQPERVEQALRQALAPLLAREPGELLYADCEIRTNAVEVNTVEESMDVTQGKLAMGFRTGGNAVWEEDYPALLLCNAVFGGTTLSKLFLNVREKLSLCYYASSMLEKMKGVILVSSGIEFDKYQEARDEILHQLEEIRQGRIEDWELEGARRTVISGYRSYLDNQGQLEDFWLGQAAAGLDTEIEELTSRLEGVTASQVAAAAQKLELDTVYFLKGVEG